VAKVQPPPDTKDWTWTLTRRCPDCGLAAGEIDPAEIGDRAGVAAAEWVQILGSSPAVGSRPEPDVWSPLEYGAHVRDVYRLFDARLARMLTEDAPTFAAAASRFVARWSALEPAQLDRPGRRSDGAEFTVASFGQYLLHDIVHHLWDVTGQQDGIDDLR
jgi:hypothetical protein